MAYHGCEFFRVFSNYSIEYICSHTGSRWMVYHHCEFFHGSSMHLMLSICSHTGSSWMAYHLCEFFNEPSSYLVVNICSHTGSSCMVYYQSEFSHGFSNYPLAWMFCHNRCKGILICVSSCFHDKCEDKTEMNCIGLISLPSILSNNQKNCCFKIVDIWHMRYIILLQETIAIVAADT